jgi:hypothetical protein
MVVAVDERGMTVPMTDLPELPFIDTMMTTLVFYDIGQLPPIVESKTFVEKICKLLNETPSHAHVGMGEGKKSRGPKFNMVDKAIAKGDFATYTYFEGVNYFQKGNVRDCSLAVCVEEIAGRTIASIHFQRNRVQPVEVDALNQKVMKFFQPNYGILYNLTLREGPLWFTSGAWSSGMPDELGQASSEFRQEYLFGKKFTDGFFRDVFKWNYLSRAHLDKTIEGMRFQDWIDVPLKKKGWLGKAKSRGTLSLLDNGCAVWELTKGEATEVRPRMLKAGLLMVKS